jgi:hypothetical protein
MITWCPVCRRRGMTSRIIREYATGATRCCREAEHIGQAGVSEWVLAAGEQEYSAPGRLGKFAGDVEIALRDEHLVGGR